VLEKPSRHAERNAVEFSSRRGISLESQALALGFEMLPTTLREAAIVSTLCYRSIEQDIDLTFPTRSKLHISHIPLSEVFITLCNFGE
jgi:hypothetical protein